MFHGWNGGGWASGGFGFGFPWGGLAMGLLVIGLGALAILGLYRSRKAGYTSSASPRERGLDILTERFVRGEIDTDTFRAMKAELEAKV